MLFLPHAHLVCGKVTVSVAFTWGTPNFLYKFVLLGDPPDTIPSQICWQAVRWPSTERFSCSLCSWNLFQTGLPISPFWIPGNKLVFLDGNENNVSMAARHYMALDYNPSDTTTDILKQENHSEFCDFRNIYDKDIFGGSQTYLIG